MSENLISMRQAIAAKLTRVRDPSWTDAYLVIPWTSADKMSHGFWFQLYERGVQQVCELPTPQPVALSQLMLDDVGLVAYDGPIDREDNWP